MRANLIIDGGTTNLRVFLLNAEDDSIICSSKAEGGVKYTAIDGNNSRLCTMLKNCIEEVLSISGLSFEDIDRATAFGMITSGMGLFEIPHLCAPVTPVQMHESMKSKVFEDIAPMRIDFIPGVRNFSGEVTTSNVSAMDMMRGEETESVGLYRLLGLKESAVFILPGSHNKFVLMGENGAILGCMTSISGELLDAISHNTIIAGSVNNSFCNEETYDREYLLAGAEECMKSGLGRACFSGRILNTLGKTAADKIQSYILGAVLAEDIKALDTFKGTMEMPKIYVAGKKPVQQAVIDILDKYGNNAYPVSEETAKLMGITGALNISRL